MWRFLNYTLVLSTLLAAGCASAGTEGPATGADAQPVDVPDADPGAPDARPGVPDARPGAPDAMASTPDAMPTTPDAMPTTPDAMPSTPDAMPSTPDAGGGCTNTNVQYLVNSNFDSGPGSWVEAGGGFPVIVDEAGGLPATITPHTGTYVAWLGGVDGATISISQDVTIPAGATNVELVGVRWIATAEISTITDWDTYAATIRSTAGTVLETVASLGNTDAANAWISWGGALSGNYAGQTIRVQVESTQDSIDNTNFFTDTVVLRATICL